MKGAGKECRDRSLLTVHQLEAFVQFCIERGGWEQLPVKDYEALRMRRPAAQPGKLEWLIVHGKLSTAAGGKLVHLTVWGNSVAWAKKFLREKKTLATRGTEQ